jgi:hypothetical protein
VTKNTRMWTAAVVAVALLVASTWVPDTAQASWRDNSGDLPGLEGFPTGLVILLGAVVVVGAVVILKHKKTSKVEADVPPGTPEGAPADSTASKTGSLSIPLGSPFAPARVGLTSFPEPDGLPMRLVGR